eukprot:TRINITY_DN48182_c0_g1_i1.p1 TRINITY_DN48182_c0_g1~~TRINITY_DN48182_c0_g1_i1.p1  ORF type:complete len:421 (+),score=154.62 TRINITY_DN48182_c0_g1_i1:68-1330(+)
MQRPPPAGRAEEAAASGATTRSEPPAAAAAPQQPPPPPAPNAGAAAGAEGGPAHICDKDPHALPTVVLVVGMAGSGKSTLMHRLNVEMHERQIPSFFINLDPAVLEVPFGVNIDIRDTVNYKEVMRQYSLGPNGAIVTSLNLFATRFNQVVSFLEQRQSGLKYVFIDTPGQIEVFTWSASGQIIMETLASTFPTVMLYVMDAARSHTPATFMSNMLYSCSMLYRTQLPLLLCINKIDIADHSEMVRWMRDADEFARALERQSSYSASLTQSMSQVLEEFYRNLTQVGVSAVTGQGAEALLEGIAAARGTYIDTFLPELRARDAQRKAEEAQREAGDRERLARDLAASGGFTVVAAAGRPWDGPVHGLGEGDGDGREAESGSDDGEPLRRAGLEDDAGQDGAPPRHLLAAARGQGPALPDP